MIKGIIYSLLSILFASFYGYCNGAAHSIIMVRTHLGKQPYKDCFHLLNLFHKIGLFLWGVFTILTLNNGSLYYMFLPSFLTSCFISLFLWELQFNNKEKWYILDESLQISTGIVWLDKYLGLHH